MKLRNIKKPFMTNNFTPFVQMKTKYYSFLFLLLVCIQFKVYSQDESFETTVPSYWATTNGTLNTSTDYYKHGSKSLKWDWSSNAILTVSNLQSHGLSASQVADFYNHFFRMWVYNTNQISGGNLQIEFYDNFGTKQFYFSFGLNYTGWRAATTDYTAEMSGNKTSTNITTMKILAPTSGSGTLFFDFIDFTMPRITERAKDYQLPFITNIGGDLHWIEMMYYQSLPKTIAVTPPTGQELSDLAVVKAKYDAAIKGSVPNSATLATATNQYNAANISYSGGIVKGNPLYGKDNPDTENLQVVENFILVFARDFKFNNNTTSKDNFINSVRYLLDQGYADGSLMETLHHIGFSFRNIPSAIHLMQSELITAGLWGQAQKMVEWYSAVDGIWSPDASNSNMDDGNTRAISRLGACLYKSTPEEQVQYLKGYKQYIETFLTLYPKEEEGMKADYTSFHHNIYYPGYAFPAYNNLAQTIGYMSQGSYAISANANNNLKKSLLLARVISEGGDIPNSLSGRNPFVTPSFKNGLKNLGLANPIDANLLKAHNYTYGNDSNTSSYGTETPPTGFWQINFANLGAYRQLTWVADIKGFNKYFYGTEIYSSENRYGRYQSYGAIEILYTGGYTNSLLNINGWDWNKTPGATTKYLSNTDLVAATARQDETTDSNFAASLRFDSKDSYYIDQNIEGKYGIFGMDFTQKVLSPTHDASFKFKKSVFCFDGKMICLGSNISSGNGLIETNLFQNSLSSTATPINVNNTLVATFPYNTTVLNAADNWIIDAANTGYFVKSGNSIVIDRKNQTSPSENGTGTTTGNFASAYITHGNKPTNADYEYVIIPQTTAVDMTTFNTNMASANTAFYQVILKNQNAHIVKYSDMYGYSLFTANGNYGLTTPIQNNSAPCLIMTKQTIDNLALSFVNPDLNFGANNGTSQAVPVVITLNGEWTVNSYTGGIVNATISSGTTTVTIKAKDGLPVDILFQKSSNITSSIFYYEDFSSNTNGILTTAPAIVSTITTYPAVRRVSDIPDLLDSNTLFDPTTERPATVIPRGATRTDANTRTIAITGNDSTTNYAGDVYVVFPTIDMTSTNVLIGSNGYKYASFWSERRYGDGDIAVAEILVSTNYTTIAGTTWTTLPLILGKLAKTADGLNYVNGVVDLSSYANGANGTTVTLALRYKCSNTTYSGTNRNGTFYFSDLKFYSQATQFGTTWNGTTWSNGAPSADVDAFISGNYSESVHLSAKTLTVNNNAIAVIPSNYNVTINGALTVSSGSFTLNNNANLIQSTNVVNSGNSIVKRNSSLLNRLDYTIWSSPVTNTIQNLLEFSPLTLTNRFYNYNTTTNLYNVVLNPSTATFAKGVGYLIRMPDTNPAYPSSTIYQGVFSGVPNNGAIPVTLNYVSASQGYNMIGNPYPSTIDAEAFLTANSANIESTLYFWRKTNGAGGSAYATYTLGGATTTTASSTPPNGTIQVGQGFFVQAKTTGTIPAFFTNAMRVTNNANQFFKTKAIENNRIWLNLTNPTGAFSQMLVGYMTNATQGIDTGIDGKYINDSAIALTSKINNEEYTIQGRALPFSPNDVVELNFKTDVSGEYTIGIAHVDGLFANNQDVYLYDNITGAETNLKLNSYTFVTAAGLQNERFSLKYQQSLNTNTTEFNDNSIKVYNNNGILYVNSNSIAIHNIKVYDIQGKLIAEQKDVNKNTATITDLDSVYNQVLIVKVSNVDGNLVYKKVVN